MIFRYGFEAFTISQWEGAAIPTTISNGTFASKELLCVGKSDVKCLTPEEILQAFSFNINNFILDLLAMLAFIFVFYGIGFVGLLIRVKRSR